MTTPIAAIGTIAPVSHITPAASTGATSAAGGVDGTPVTSGSDFATMLGHGLDALTNTQANAESLGVQAATGQLTNPAALTIATTQATLMTQLATSLQSKAVTAFNTIMGMQA
jgi:flagellar hook-basal body complex protein FliE